MTIIELFAVNRIAALGVDLIEERLGSKVWRGIGELGNYTDRGIPGVKTLPTGDKE